VRTFLAYDLTIAGGPTFDGRAPVPAAVRAVVAIGKFAFRRLLCVFRIIFDHRRYRVGCRQISWLAAQPLTFAFMRFAHEFVAFLHLVAPAAFPTVGIPAIFSVNRLCQCGCKNFRIAEQDPETV
jgi:hypothetical protein